MTAWKHKLPLKDIWAEYEQAIDSDAAAVGQRMAGRLREQAWFEHYPELEDIADAFAGVATIAEFDGVLEELYDWADENKRCWVETF